MREPLRALVEEMDVRLARIAPELVGDPRRSIFRIHRDVRFSKDKSPYKTNAACQFYHHDAGRGAGQDADGAGAGLYFQLADGECFVAGGMWMPARPALEKIREALAEDPEGLARIARAPGFRRRFRALSEEAMLSRLPRGYAEGHPAERWLRYKSFTASRMLTDREVASPRLAAMLERDFAALVPLVRWLNGAIGYRAWERRFFREDGRTVRRAGRSVIPSEARDLAREWLEAGASKVPRFARDDGPARDEASPGGDVGYYRAERSSASRMRTARLSGENGFCRKG